MERIKSENKEEKVIANEIEGQVKMTDSQPSNSSTANFEKLFAQMQKQINDQAEMIKKQNEVISKMSNTSVSNSGSNAELIRLLEGLQPQPRNDVGSVKVICLEDCGQAMFKLQNGRIIKFRKEGIDQTTYGKIVPVSLEDATLLLNEYTTTFERGALKFDEDHMYMLREKGINVDAIDYKPMESIAKFEELDNEGIKNLYNSLRVFQRDMLKTHIVKLLTSNKVKNLDTFVEKIKLLNRISKADSIDGKTGSYELILNKLREVGVE